MEVEQMEKDYERMVSDLLNWLNSKILELGRPFQKSMMAVQREMATFKHFRTVEKPPKYADFTTGSESFIINDTYTLNLMRVSLTFLATF